MDIETSDVQNALHVMTKVRPGHRIEISVPQLAEGESVEVFLIASRRQADPGGRRSMLEFLGTLPPGPRSSRTWKAFERALQEERVSWDR